jgi:D-tyrosyl-tRNA(Tyr) deacylase
MKALIQRVNRAKVTVDNRTTGEIGQGILVLLGITHEDSEKDVNYLVEKIVNLRIFGGEGKSSFGKSVIEIGGSLLVVSQFTLYGSTKKGRRPDFTAAAKPDFANGLYEMFIDKARETGIKVETGEFGAMMDVELINSGPVTFMIESPTT